MNYYAYQDLIKENIDYSALCMAHSAEDVDGIVALMTDTVCSSRRKIVIGGEFMPAAVVRSRLLSLDYSHIEYVLGCMSRTTTKINNIKHYLLTTLYNALYYTRDVKSGQDALVESLFQAPVPKPAAQQKQTFEALLTTSLGEECSMEVMQTVHEELCQRIELHKESKIPDPLLISKEDVKEVFSTCGISDENLSKFSVDYDEAFGFDADLHPKNIIDNKHFEIKTPDVVIKVDPSRSDLIETRVIGGVKYIMICAEEDVEVNGVSIHIKEEDKDPVTV